MIQGVYIADNTNNLVYEYLVNSSFPSFKALRSYINAEDLDKLKVPLIEINSDYYVSFQKTKSLIIYVLCSYKDTFNPVLPYIFIRRLLEVMEDYFGSPLAVVKIEANSDTLTLLLSEMIDDGIPNITEFNKLREIIPFKGFFSKLLSASTDLASAATQKSFTSLTHNTRKVEKQLATTDDTSTPWRRSNVVYTNNEMYVDITETLNVILKPIPAKGTQGGSYVSPSAIDSAFYSTISQPTTKLVPITGSILGKIEFLSHLTGVPYLHMALQCDRLDFGLPSFHRCIRLDRWNKTPGDLYFIPPDGKSTLMNYEIDLDSVDRSKRDDILNLFTIDFKYNLGPKGRDFEIFFSINSHKNVSKVENLSIGIHCTDVSDGKQNGDTSSKASSSADSADSDIKVESIKTTKVTHGDFLFKGNGMGEWNLRSIVAGAVCVLHGTIITNKDRNEDGGYYAESFDSNNLIEGDYNADVPEHKVRPAFLTLNYLSKGSVPSGLKVDSLKIISAKGLGETVKPYKGVKYITKTENFIIRS